MASIDITATLDQIEIGATGLAEIIQNVKTIVSTVRGTVPLDREFGVDGEYIDRPQPVIEALFMADVVAAVNKYEPRVTVSQVFIKKDIPGAMDGKLVPVIRIKVNEGVL